MKTLKQILEIKSIEHYQSAIHSLRNYTKERNLHYSLKDHYKIMNPAHESDIKNYTGGGYLNVNQYLWDKHKGEIYPNEHNKYHIERMENQANDLQHALHSYKTPHQLTLFSSIRENPDIKENKIYHHPGFLSASLDHNPPFSGSKAIKQKNGNVHYHSLRIRVPEGHPGAYVDHHSVNQGEHEFILPHGTNLKHVHTQVYEGPYQSPFEHNFKNMLVHYHTMDIVK